MQSGSSSSPPLDSGHKRLRRDRALRLECLELAQRLVRVPPVLRETHVRKVVG